MDDNSKQELNEEPQEGKKVPGFIWTLIAVTVAAIIAVSAYRNGTGFDAINRFFTYTIGDTSVAYQYDDSTETQFGMLGDTLVTLTATKVEVQAYGGEILFTDLCYMQNPSLEVGTGYAVAYDVGGDDYYVVDEKGLVYRGILETGASMVSATLNANDYLTLTHDGSGYKTATSVYDPAMNLIYAFRSASRFVIDAYVSDDNTTLVAATLGAVSGNFVSELLYYPLSQTTADNQCVLEGVLPVEFGQQGTSLLVLDASALNFVSLDGTVTAQYYFEGEYLRSYDCTSPYFTALLLNRYQAGNEGRLVTVDGTGAELGSLNIQEEVMNISVNDGYLAVLYSDSLVIYTKELVPFYTVNDIDYANHVELQQDGSVVVFGRERAQVIAP